MDLEHKVAIVTGAARGLGRAIAGELAGRGARVVLADLLEDELEQTAADMRDAGMEVMPVITDTTDVAQVETMADAAERELGPIEILVNNAGTFSVIGPVWEAEPDKWFRDIHVNLYGSFLCCRAIVRRMIPRGRGCVINIVSSGGVGDPHPYCTSYASSKAGLMRLTEGLAKETEKHGIAVFAVGPPAIRTKMTEFIMRDQGGRRWRPGFARIFEEGKDTPAEEVAQFVAELCDGKADQLTGRFLDPRRPLDQLLAEVDRIMAEDLWTLRIVRA